MRQFLAFVLCLILLPFAAPAQSDDRGFLTRFLEDNLSDAGREVRVIGFEGALSSVARIAELTIADDDGIWLALRGVELDWSRAAALTGRIEINRLSAQEIDLLRPPLPSGPSPEATPFSLPELPVSVRIGEIAAGRVMLGAPLLGQEVVLRLQGSADLAGGAGNADITVERIDGPRGRIALAGGYSNATRVLRLGLELDEAEGGLAATLMGLPGAPALVLSVTGEAPLDDFAADIRLASDGQDRLRGRVELAAGDEGQRFRAELAGDVAPLFLPEYRDFFGTDIRLLAEGSRAESGALELSQLELSAAELSLSGRVQLAADGLPALVDLALDIGNAAGTPVLLPLSGPETRLAGAQLRFGFDGAGDDGWRLSGTVTGLDRPDLDIAALRLAGSGRIARQSGGAQVVGGTLRFDASGIGLDDPALADALGDAVQGQTRFFWSAGEPLRLSRLAVEGADYGLSGAVQVDGGTVGANLLARMEDFGRLSALAGRPLGGSGELGWSGTVELLSGAFDGDLRVAGRAIRLAVPELDNLLRGDSVLTLSAARGAEGIEIRALDLRAATLGAQAAGWLRSTGSDLTGRLGFDDLSVLGPQYGGALTADLAVTAGDAGETLRLTGAARNIAIGLPEVDGLLRGDTRLALSAARRDGRIHLDDLRVDGAVLTATAQGVLDEPAAARNLRATVALRDLSALGPQYRGRVEARATYALSGGTEAVTLDGEAVDAAIGQPQVDGLLRGRTRFLLAAERDADGAILIDRLTVDGAVLEARLSGLYSDARRDLALDARLSDLSALGAAYRGRIEARIGYGFGDGTESVDLTATGSGLRVGQAEADLLLRGDTSVSLRANRRAGVVRVEQALVENPQLSLRADARIEDALRRVTISGRLADLAPFVPGVPGAVTLQGTVDENGGPLRVDLAARGPGGIDATISGTVEQDFSRMALRIAGGAETALANAFIAPVSLRGPVRFDLAVNGPPGLSAVSGRVEIRDTRLALTSPPLAFRGVAATVALSGGRAQVDARGTLETGGTFAVSGPVALTAPFAGDLAITLDQLRLVDPNLYSTSLSGALRVNGPLAGGAAISGGMRLGETELRIPSSGLGGTAAIPDLRHLNEPAAVRATRARAGLLDSGRGGRQGGGSRPYGLDLTLDAPNRIFVRGRGLDAELGGALRIGGTTDNIIPSGGFDLIRGRLDLLGKRFTLDEGALRLEGDFVPHLRLSASTEADGVRTTIAVDGPADAPVIRFLSTPELPEEEVVSRLLFGRGLNTLTPIQAAQLASAVATLTGRGGGGVVDRLRRSFGLDDLDVTQDAEGGAAVRAGRYLSENVYVDVTVGSSGSSEISLNLDVSPSVVVRGRAASDGATGIGVYFERDY